MWHDGLLQKLYIDGITGDMWRLIRSLHEGTNIKVKWNSEVTDKIDVEQGIRQGAKLSTTMYKRYNNNILHSLEQMNLGPNIGTNNLTSPTCADDLALLERSMMNMQSLAQNVFNHTCKDRFTINPAKSEIITFNKRKTSSTSDMEIKIQFGNVPIQPAEKIKHLGIERNKDNTPDTATRIQTARKTSYALMGTGMHGKNGISPLISASLWDTFIIPRMLHGIEFLTIRKGDIEKLEGHQRKTLKLIQGLPENTATSATYLLLGKLPIEGLIDLRFMSAFIGIVCNPDSIEYQIAKRQLLMKEETSSSWFIKVNEIRQKYGIRTALDVISCTDTKTRLKTEFKQAATDFWNQKLKDDCRDKTTLKFFAAHNLTPGQPHLVWKSAKHSPMETRKAAIKVRLMTGTYQLGYIQARNKKVKDSNCVLCQREPEDEQYFIAKCPVLEGKRILYLDKISKLTQEKHWKSITNDKYG